MTELATIRATVARAKSEGLPISEKSLRRWVADGTLSFVPAGNRRMIYWPTLLAFLAQGQRTDSTPRPLYGRGSRGGKR